MAEQAVVIHQMKLRMSANGPSSSHSWLSGSQFSPEQYTLSAPRFGQVPMDSSASS